MNQLDVSLIVNEAISEQLNIKLKDITDETTMGSFGADSLDIINVLIDIEESLQIEIEDDAVTKETTVAELTAKVKNIVEANNEC